MKELEQLFGYENDLAQNVSVSDISQAGMGINVHILKRDAETRRVIEERHVKNRVTKRALMGYVRLINGEFNESTPEEMDDYIPRWLALGTNRAGGLNPGVTTEVTVNDAKLLGEVSPRLFLAQKNIIDNRYTNNYIKLTIKAYIGVDQFVGETLGEAGLFAYEEGNNLWARVAFDYITKSANEVLDITWDITIVSAGTTVYAESVYIMPDDINFKSIGARQSCRAIVSPSNTTVTQVEWASSNEKVATVNQYGTVISTGVGTCKITATTVNDLIATANVTVTT